MKQALCIVFTTLAILMVISMSAVADSYFNPLSGECYEYEVADHYAVHFPLLSVKTIFCMFR